MIKHPLFKGLTSRFLDGLDQPDLLSILEAATPRQFPAHFVIAEQGAPAGSLFLLTAGCARHFFMTPNGKKILLFLVLPGDICGAGALLPGPFSYQVSTETVKESRALVWSRPHIRSLVAKYPRLVDNAHLIASDYVGWYAAANAALICHSAQQRLAEVLITLSATIGRKVPGGAELEITNEDLANAANVTLFTASRLVSKWHRDGAVVKSRGKIVVRSPDRLSVR